MESTINTNVGIKEAPFTETDWTNKTILVADDVKINFLLLKAMLGKTRAKLLWARDGEQAIEFCKNNSNIDVVLMDFSMPKKNGYEATKEIRKIRRNLPIISQTTSSMGSYEFDSLAASCDDYIIKPLSKKRLIYKIGKYINK